MGLGNSIRDIIEKKGEASSNPTVNNAIKQSKTSSLSMSVFKSITPLVTRCLIDSNNTEHFVNSVRESVEAIVQKTQFQGQTIRALSGGLTDEETFVWRRAFAISSEEFQRVSKVNTQFVLALLTNTEKADLLVKQAGVDKQAIQSIAIEINEYNRYQEKDTFFSTVNSSILSSTTKIDRTLSNIEFFTEKAEAYEIINNAIAVTAEALYRKQSELPHSSQKTMLRKSCLNHATYIITNLAEQLASEYDFRVKPTHIDEFDEKLEQRVSLCTEAIQKTSKAVVSALWNLENEHEASSELKQSFTDTDVSTLINNVELLTKLAVVSDDENGQDHIQAKRFSQLVKDVCFIVDYAVDNSNYIVKLDRNQSKSFARSTFYKSLSEPLIYLRQTDTDLSVKHLKMCNNIAVYLLSEQSAFNEVMNRNGMMPEQIQQFRRSRDVAFSVNANNPLTVKQIALPTIAELTSVLFETQRYTWGISTAYLAPKLGKYLLDATNKVYLSCRERNQSSSTSIYRASLEASSQVMRTLWRNKTNQSLSHSNRSYVTGSIPIEECLEIIDAFQIEYMNQVDEMLYQSSKLQICIDEVYGQSDEYDYDNAIKPS